MKHVIRFLLGSSLICCLAAMLGGCGYHQNELFPENIHTIAVPIFQNRSFYKGMEFDLTEALIKEIELRTPYKVSRTASAQSILQGEITRVVQTGLSNTREGGLIQEVELRLVVNFSWKRRDDSKTLRRRDGMIAIGRYVPTRPIGEPLEIAKHLAVQNLAKKIVSAMRADW